MASSTRRYNPYLLAGNRVTAALRRPGVAEDGKVPVWDNAAKRFKPGAGGGGSVPAGIVVNCGNWDASGGLCPNAGGTGAAGAILNGNKFTISVAGVIGGVDFPVGAIFIAKIDAPGQILANWDTIQ